jgi:hypothetical protein
VRSHDRLLVLQLDGQQDLGQVVRGAMRGDGRRMRGGSGDGGGRNSAHGTPVECGADGADTKRYFPEFLKTSKKQT